MQVQLLVLSRPSSSRAMDCWRCLYTDLVCMLMWLSLFSVLLLRFTLTRRAVLCRRHFCGLSKYEKLYTVDFVWWCAACKVGEDHDNNKQNKNKVEKYFQNDPIVRDYHYHLCWRECDNSQYAQKSRSV